VCDGFHILAPALRATPATHTAIRAIGLAKGLLNDFKFPVPVLEDSTKWWDASVVRPSGNSWFIFGLGKVGRPAYKTITTMKSLPPVEQEDGSLGYNIKRLIASAPEPKFRREASYAMNRAVPALEVKPEMAAALLDSVKPLKVKAPSTPSSNESVAESVSSTASDLIVSLNTILKLPASTPWQVKEKTSKKFVGMPMTTSCLCADFQHSRPKQSQLIVNASQKKSAKPSAVAQCFDYTTNHGIVKLDDSVALQLYGLLFNSEEPEDDDIYSHPNYVAVKEAFEEEVVKICVPVCFNVKIEDEWLSLTEDKLKQLFKNKGFVIEGDKGKERKSFIQTWLTDPSMLTYTRFAFYPEPSSAHQPTSTSSRAGHLSVTLTLSQCPALKSWRLSLPCVAARKMPRSLCWTIWLKSSWSHWSSQVSACALAVSKALARISSGTGFASLSWVMT
jgi:hypothetical protein